MNTTTQDKHTPEPWKYVEFLPRAGVEIGHADTYEQTLWLNNRSDARRIVACVNACAGIGTEELEAFAGDPSILMRAAVPALADAIAQRDELAAALRLELRMRLFRLIGRRICNSHRARDNMNMLPRYDSTADNDPMVIRLRAALAKVQS